MGSILAMCMAMKPGWNVTSLFCLGSLCSSPQQGCSEVLKRPQNCTTCVAVCIVSLPGNGAPLALFAKSLSAHLQVTMDNLTFLATVLDICPTCPEIQKFSTVFQFSVVLKNFVRLVCINFGPMTTSCKQLDLEC